MLFYLLFVWVENLVSRLKERALIWVFKNWMCLLWDYLKLEGGRRNRGLK
jgi:hypothetical protein